MVESKCVGSAASGQTTISGDSASAFLVRTTSCWNRAPASSGSQIAICGMLGCTSAILIVLGAVWAWRKMEKPEKTASTTTEAGRMISRTVNQRFAGFWTSATMAHSSDTENHATRNDTPYTPV